MLRLLLQEIMFRRNAVIGWSLGLCFFPLVYISIYPSVADEMAGLADLEIYQAMGMSLGGFGDWVGSILVIFMPLVASIYAVLNGTGSLAGEEEDGRLEMLVTLPLPRWKIVTAKALALTLSLTMIFVVVAGVAVVVLGGIEGQIETDIGSSEMFLAVMGAWPMVFAFGMLSMFLAAFCSSRRVAAMIAIAYLLVSYFGSNLASSTSVLEPFEPLFLFTYIDASGQAVVDGQAAGDVLVLLAVGLVSFALAIVFFQRRKLTVGAWPWQRGLV